MTRFTAREKTDLSHPTEADIADLWQVYEHTPPQLFTGFKKVSLNPTFGDASVLVGGADADVIFDSFLVDIKTVKELELKPDYWTQLLGYAVLADLEKGSKARLDSVGIYFSRHAILWKFQLGEIYEHKKYPAFKQRFEKTAKATFHQDGKFRLS